MKVDANLDGVLDLIEWLHAAMDFFYVGGPDSPFSLLYGPLVEEEEFV